MPVRENPIRVPLVPALYSMLVDKAVKTSLDGELITVRRADVIEHEQDVRRYYKRLSEGRLQDLTNLNAFTYLFYKESLPKEVERRYFNIILYCYIHAHRDYLLTDGITRTDAQNSLRTDLFCAATIAPYFHTWTKKTFASFWFRFARSKWVEHVPDHLPLYTEKRKFVKRFKYYTLSAAAEQLIKDFQGNVIAAYDDTITTLRARAHLLHTFANLPDSMKSAKKRTIKKQQKHIEKVKNDLLFK